MAGLTSLVLRTKERKVSDGTITHYQAAEFFCFDQWFSTDIHTARDELLMQKMADYFGVELRDERNK